MTSTPPPLDAECAAVLATLPEVVPFAITADVIPAMRALTGPALSDDDLRRDGAFTVEQRSVPGPAGAPGVSLLICRPAAATAPVPALYNIHGGGMVMGDNRTAINVALDWAQPLGLAVVSVEYRLAPETKYPGPVEDCYAGLVWTAAHAAELGIDPAWIIIDGPSAGGGLAAAVTLLARDRKGPALAGQILLCPMLDDRNDTVSAAQMAGLGQTWNQASNRTGWSALLGQARGGPDVPAYAAPARATDLSGLPPTFIDVGSAETFRDETVAYASRIWQAGGIAELHVWPGGFHGYANMAPQAQISVATRAATAAWLRRLISARLRPDGTRTPAPPS